MKKVTFKSKETKIGKKVIPSHEIVEFYDDTNKFASDEGLKLRASALNWVLVSIEQVNSSIGA